MPTNPNTLKEKLEHGDLDLVLTKDEVNEILTMIDNQDFYSEPNDLREENFTLKKENLRLREALATLQGNLAA